MGTSKTQEATWPGNCAPSQGGPGSPNTHEQGSCRLLSPGPRQGHDKVARQPVPSPRFPLPGPFPSVLPMPPAQLLLLDSFGAAPSQPWLRASCPRTAPGGPLHQRRCAPCLGQEAPSGWAGHPGGASPYPAEPWPLLARPGRHTEPTCPTLAVLCHRLIPGHSSGPQDPG